MTLALKYTQGYIYRAVAVEVPWSEHIQGKDRVQGMDNWTEYVKQWQL